MNNSVNLVFDKTLTKLAGFPYGEKIFDEQVKDQVDFSKTCEIVFPENIESVVISFVNGFFTGIVNKIGLQGIDDNILLKTSSEELTKDIWKKLHIVV